MTQPRIAGNVAALNRDERGPTRTTCRSWAPTPYDSEQQVLGTARPRTHRRS